MITNTINKEFEKAKSRGWDYIYWAIDIHDTMIKSNYQSGNIPSEFYPHAKETLQMLTKRTDVKLILYTCSHPHEIEQYKTLFAENDINFDFINENPEVKTDTAGYGNYDKKFYFNVLLDDKAGFEPLTDWEDINTMMKPQHELPYLTDVLTIRVREYNPNFGDDKTCECGHSYYRHFDSYEEMSNVGCKYCHCNDFKEKTHE